MEMIFAPMDHQQFGKDAAPWQHAAEPATARRLPSLFRHVDPSSSPLRLVGMSDVLNAARLPSIGSMIRRDDSPRVDTTSPEPACTPVNSMSPAQKHSIDLFKQLRELQPSAPLDDDARNHPEYALGNLLAGAALSQLASIQEKREAAESQQQFEIHDKMRALLPAIHTSHDDASSSDKSSKRTNSAKLCGMSECRKRAKAGGYCIAHGGGLRCSEDGCQKHAVSLGLCISHGGGKRCTIEGCLNASRKNGVCWSHGGKRLCKLDGCNKGPKSGGYCWSHGGKMKK